MDNKDKVNRIENIIDDCYNCRWFEKYVAVNSNTNFAYICLKTENIVFLTSSKDTWICSIPDYCTLPKTELKKINQIESK